MKKTQCKFHPPEKLGEIPDGITLNCKWQNTYDRAYKKKGKWYLLYNDEETTKPDGIQTRQWVLESRDITKPPAFDWVRPEDCNWDQWCAWNDRILVMTSEGPAIVYVPENGHPEYEHMDEFADPEEWTAWSNIPSV